MTQEKFDRYMERLDAITDQALDKVDMKSFDLSKRERDALGKLPDIVLDRAIEVLERYSPVGPDNRYTMVRKAVAQMALIAPELRKAIDEGYKVNQ